MPKLEVYQENKPEEAVVRLQLVQEDDCVTLIAVDKHGEMVSRGNILTINSNGTMTRIPSVRPDIGFKLDDLGRIVEEEEDED